jgi:hypothetical protein
MHMKGSVVRLLSCTVVLTVLAILTPDTVALAGELAGVTLSDTLKAGDKTLKLNGLGLRKRALFKVYVGSPSENLRKGMLG